MTDVLDFSAKRTVLAVDDTPENLAVINGVLREHYTVKAAPSGGRALEIAFSDPPPDLILLDIMMPEMDGYEVLRRLQADSRTSGIPVIFVTAKDEEQDEKIGLDLGAVDYIAKPISPAILLARVHNHLLLKETREFLKDEKRYLERQVGAMQNVALHAFASLAEMRDDETPNHVRRMQHYVRTLAERLKTHSRFADALDDATIDLIFRSVPLHDIGKVGVPDYALVESEKLTDASQTAMRAHAALGRDAILRAQQVLAADSEFLKHAREMAYSHHERWDGSGYPQGLSGNDIPLSARLLALADVYDTLVTWRPEKPPMPHTDAAQILVAARGSHFDPDVVDAFVQSQQDFCDIAARFADTEADVADHIARYRR